MKYNTYQIVKRILTYGRPYRIHIFALFILSLVGTPLALLQPFIMKFIIDSGFGSQPVPTVIKMFFPANFEFTFKAIAIIAVSISVALALINNIIGNVSWIYATFTGEKLVLNFRALLFNHIQRLSLAYHDKQGASDSLYRIQYDTQAIRSFLLNHLSSLITSFITLSAMVTIMFTINWQFAVIAICVLPFFVVLTKLSTKRLKRDYYSVKDAESSAMAVVHEVLSSLRVVKAFGQEENENSRFINRSNKAVEWQLQTSKIGATYSFLVNMLVAVVSAVFLYLAAVFVHEGKMTLGALTVVLAYLAQIFSPLQAIIKSLNEIQSLMASVERVFTVLDEETEVKESADAIHLKRVKGGFEFENISFAYDKDRPTLSEISFEIKPGDRVGVMGSTGAGKSTLINLLNRFYDPLGGSIKVDGQDIRTYKLADYRKQFSIVLQEPVLFSTTIAENIRYGRPEATEEEIIEAAIAANAHNFITKSKDGYSTVVGERGMKLSGGERQRISLARAFIKNAPVLILDEPTSSLDIKTEALIMDAMERLMEGRTTFMITHRLDTLNSCNIILHLENGKLLEVVRDHDIHFIKNKKASFLSQ